MKINSYSIRDGKGCIFGRPFFQVNNSVAMRTFQDLVADPQTEIHRHPDDFKLYLVGSFDDNTGVLAPEVQPVFLAHGTDFVQK